MAASQQQLNFAIKAINEASATLKKVQDDVDGLGHTAAKSGGMMSGFGKSLGNVASIAGGFVVAQGLISAPGFLLDAAKAAGDDEASMLRLQKAVENTGASWEKSKSSIDASIVAGQRKAFSDDQVRAGLSLLTAQTGDAEEAQRRFALAMDLARGANIDVETASKLLGKVTEENVNVLGRYGLAVEKGTTETELFAMIQAKFGGQADAFANSTAGQMARASDQMAELKEQLGAAILPALTAVAGYLVTTLLPAIAQFGTWFQERVMPPLQVFAAAFMTIFRDTLQPAIAAFMAFILAQWLLFLPYYEENIKPIFDRFLASINEIILFISENWPLIMGVIGPSMELLGTVVGTVFGLIGDTINVVIELLNGDLAGAWRAVGTLIENVWDGVVGATRSAVNVIIGYFNVLINAWNALGFNIDTPFGGSIHIGTPDIPNIPQLAEGGIVTRPTLAWLGEAGTEAIIPLNKFGSGDGGGGGNTYQVIVMSPDALLSTIVDLERSGRLAAGVTSA